MRRCTPTITLTKPNPPTTAFPAPFMWLQPSKSNIFDAQCAGAARHLAAKIGRIRPHRQNRPHPPARRHPAHAGQEFSGYVSQLDHGLQRLEAALQGLSSCLWAARPWAPASTATPITPKKPPPRWPNYPACLCERAPINLRRSPPAMPPCLPAAHSKPGRKPRQQNRQRYPLAHQRPGAAASAIAHYPENEPGSICMPGEVEEPHPKRSAHHGGHGKCWGNNTRPSASPALRAISSSMCLCR